MKKWFDVGDFLSKDKISQAFQDLLRGGYKSSNRYNRKRRGNLKPRVTVDSKYRSAATKQSIYHMAVDQRFLNHQTSLLHLIKCPRNKSANIMNIIFVISNQEIHFLQQEKLNFNKSKETKLELTHLLLSLSNIHVSNEIWSTRCAKLLGFSKYFGNVDVPVPWVNLEFFSWVVNQ